MDWKKLAGLVVDELKAHITQRLAPLEQRLAQLETKGVSLADAYQGTWQRGGAAYQRGELVSHGGSLWLATADTVEQPGSGPASGWTLVVKRGRDARTEA